MLEKCTNPQALFYEADLAFLNILETNGIDVPCSQLSALLIGSTSMALMLALSLSYAFVKTAFFVARSLS